MVWVIREGLFVAGERVMGMGKGNGKIASLGDMLANSIGTKQICGIRTERDLLQRRRQPTVC